MPTQLDARATPKQRANNQRQRAVERVGLLTVTINGNEYRADLDAQQLMAGWLLHLAAGEMIDWTMADGSVVSITREDLLAAHLAALQQTPADALPPRRKPRRTPRDTGNGNGNGNNQARNQRAGARP
jgi:hypothetical protein